MSDLTATAILTAKIARLVQRARKATNEASEAIGELAAERVIQNGVRRQVDEVMKHLNSLDDLYPALLQQARESYGDAPREDVAKEYADEDRRLEERDQGTARAADSVEWPGVEGT